MPQEQQLTSGQVVGRTILILVALAVVVPLVWLCIDGIATSARNDARAREAKEQTRRIANQLDQLIADDGSYLRLETVDESDPWDRPLRVSYYRETENSALERLQVISAGIDGEFGTEDDIVATERNVIGRNVLREPARGAVSGVMDGIRDQFTNDEDE